jgi:PAS domain S-box-containing protein
MPSAREFSRIGEFSTYPLVVLDERAHATYVNSAFEELTGYPGGQIVGQNPWTLLRGDDTSQPTLDFMKNKMSKRLPFETSLVQYTRAGLPRWTGVYVVPFHDDATGEHFYAALQRELKKVGEPVMANQGFSSQVGELLTLAGS